MRFKKFLSKIIKRDRKALYITKDSVIETSKEKFDLILSPIFYWVKKEKLSVKKERDALKFAPSIFDGQFEDVEDYRYLAIKYSNEEYIFIAYNSKEIMKKLKTDFGISESMIGNIYTAQSEMLNIEESLSINRIRMVVSIDGIISDIPKHSYDSSVNYATEYLKKNSRTGLPIKYKGIDGSRINIVIASAIPLALIIYFGLDIVKLNRDLNSLNIEIDKRRDNYNLPATSFQIESIKNRYQEIDAKQLKIRDSILWLQTKNFDKYGKIISLTSDSKEIVFKLELRKGAKLNKVKSVLQKRDKNVEFDQDGNILEVSFKR